LALKPQNLYVATLHGCQRSHRFSAAMQSTNVLGVGVLAAAVFFQVWVTFRVWRSRVFEKPQKVAQSQLIWLVPVLGAVMVFSVLSSEEKHDRSGNGPTFRA
jgi:hypothetical protein